MVSEPQSSDPVDPLHGHSTLSLFPRTFRASTNAPKPNDPDDLESIHDFMKSMGLRRPDKLLEKAKAIVDAANSAAYMGNDDAVASKGKEKPQERRPGLGRKRARFSLRPSTSQPAVSLEPNLDIDLLQEPEEFFSAYEKLENAKEEIQRQRGGSRSDFNEYNPSMNARRRRPGILGKSVSYKHHYSSVLSENDDTFISSQETLGQDILNPPNCDLQQETTDSNVESQEMELPGSIAKTENRVNQLLDELLSSNSEDLDGDGALSLLQERLQIKPIDLDKLCLPDFHDIGRTDFVALGEKLPKPWNKLSDMHNLVKGMSGKTPIKRKEVAESPINPLASPTPPKSPFASISLLKKSIFQSNPSSDPFSPHNVDRSPAKNPPSIEHIDKQSDRADMRKELSIPGKLKSLVGEKVVNTGTQKVITGDSVYLPDNSVNDNLGRESIIDVSPSGCHGELEDYNGSNDMDERTINYSLSRPSTNTDVQTSEPYEMEENVDEVPQQAVSSAQPNINIEDSTRSYADTDIRMYVSTEMEENVEDMPQKATSSAQPDVNIGESTMENLNSSQSQLDKSNPAAVEDHAMDVPSTTTEIGPEHHIKKHPRISLNEQSTAKRPPRKGRQRKAISRRQSLAAAGTSWESGVRRSTREKMRPLEYWKGERFLYGRVHESLTTVIGLKYISPAKGDGKPTFKVKSFVSDKYKDLVELAALH